MSLSSLSSFAARYEFASSNSLGLSLSASSNVSRSTLASAPFPSLGSKDTGYGQRNDFALQCMIRRLAAVANPRTLKVILQTAAVAAACEMSEKLISGECIMQSILVDIVEIVIPSAHINPLPQTLQ